MYIIFLGNHGTIELGNIVERIHTSGGGKPTKRDKNWKMLLD